MGSFEALAKAYKSVPTVQTLCVEQKLCIGFLDWLRNPTGESPITAFITGLFARVASPANT